MTTHCQPLPRTLVEEMLQLVARAICDRPGENAAQGESRTNQMVHSTLGFAPRDGLEFMLASLAIGHFNLILDSMRDVFQGQPDQLKAKTKTTIVALGRAMLEMIKELREARRRPAAQSADNAQYDATVAAPSSPPMPDSAEMPLPVRPMSEDPQLVVAPASSRPADTTAAGSAPAASVTSETASGLAPTSVSGSAPLQPGDAVPDIATPANQHAVSVEGDPSPGVTPLPDLASWTDEDEAGLVGRIAANEALMAAMNESIAEAWRDHRAKQAAASGD